MQRDHRPSQSVMRPPANTRTDILALLAGKRPASTPCFSGLCSVTEVGLARLGVALADVHHDEALLVAAAASTVELFGFGAAVLPLDLCVEAEALGARVNFHRDARQPTFPSTVDYAAEHVEALADLVPADVVERGRVPLVCAALGRLRERVGETAVVGAFVPGPFTLAMYVLPPAAVVTAVVEAPDALGDALDALTGALIAVGRAYRAAGADFLTVHEMGGSPGYLGPRPFRDLVLPRLQRLLLALPAPRVLSVCGRTNRAMALLAQAGADALSVDQMCDVAAARELLGPQPVLLGNIDPVGVLAQGAPGEVTTAVSAARAAGVDAIWPGCDLWPPVPPANMAALVAAAAAV